VLIQPWFSLLNWNQLFKKGRKGMSELLSFNKFSSMPYIPYKVIAFLISNENAENIFKILKYPTYDCLKEQNLTMKEKKEMIWKGQDQMQDYNIFLTNVEENMLDESKTLLKLFRYDSLPVNRMISVVCYEFDILFGTKSSIIDYNGIPCNRGDVLEAEILKVINGEELSGVGYFQYNYELSRLCRSRANIGNNSTFTGCSFVLATQSSDLDVGC